MDLQELGREAGVIGQDRPAFDKEPFRRKYLEGEEPRQQDIIALRLNKEERAILEWAKACLFIDADGTAIKVLMFAGKGVLQQVFGEDFLRYLSSQKRVRKVS